MTLFDTAPASAGNSPDLSAAPAWTPQFANAQYGRAADERCNLCSHHLFTYFFRVNRKRICANCADQVRLGLSTGGATSFVLATFAGLIGTAAVMAAYAAVVWTTGWATGIANGFLAIFIGWIVGRIVLAGANGIGSIGLQFVAAALTYLAITLEAIPRLVWNAYNDPNTVVHWRTILPRMIIDGVMAPFVRFDINSSRSVVGLLAILLSVLIAIRFTRSRPVPVAGPFDVAATA
jgi:hypothetical protein